MQGEVFLICGKFSPLVQAPIPESSKAKNLSNNAPQNMNPTSPSPRHLSPLRGILPLLLALLGLGQASLHAVNPRGTLVGAIRWDGNTGDTPTLNWPSGNYVGQQVERALGPNKYHFRLPFFGVETGTNTVQARELTQTVMDQDIAYAKSASIDYWAFVFYPDGSGMDLARNLYSSSTHKNDVNYCFIQAPTSYFTTLVSRFTEANYQKVLGNRPLLYIFDASAYSASEIANLRSQTIAAGLGTPYIVVMAFTTTTASEGAMALGADAISSYCSGISNGDPYLGLANSDTGRWNDYKNTGRKVVPWVTTGWDPRPRIDNPVAWISYYPNNWGQTATPAEIATHLQEGLNWVDSNPTVADANTLLMYAWNEFDEGGWLSPTLYTGTDRLDALKGILHPPVPGPNLLANGDFESGLASWAAQTASLADSTTAPHSGAHALRIYNRTARWSAATQDVLSDLLANGKGLYTASTWAKFASGSDTIQIVIKTVDGNGSNWFASTPMTLGTTFKEISGQINVTWSGTLTKATIYTQTASSLADLYEDDFSLNVPNLLENAGIENGTASWVAQAGSIAESLTDVHSGLRSLRIYNRTAPYSAATQDIRGDLLANGPGYYTASAWLRFASGTDNVIVVVNTIDSAGSHWFTTAGGSIGTIYKNISDSVYVTWTGTLTKATIYIQTTSSLADLYEDDFSLTKQP